MIVGPSAITADEASFQTSIVEEECCITVFFDMKPGSTTPDGHELAVEPFRDGVGDLVLAIASDLGQA